VTLPYLLPAVLPGPLILPAPARIAGSLLPLAPARPDTLSRILCQYQESPRLLSWIGSFTDRTDTLDAVTVAIYEQLYDLDRAIGPLLDFIGALVVEAREGRADDVYRQAIAVALLVARSQGRASDLAQIAYVFERLQDVPGASVRVSDVGPARAEVRVRGARLNSPRDIDGKLRRAKSAGVSLQTIVFPLASTLSVFRLTSVAEAGGRSVLGLSGASTAGAPLAIVLS